MIPKSIRQKPTRHYSKKQETQVANAIGAKRTPNSGATNFIKGDVLDDTILIECKTKTRHSKSHSIRKEWIEKNREEAFAMGKKYSAIAFNYGPDEENFYIVSEYMFKELLQKLAESENII